MHHLASVQQPITTFTQDGEGHWVAILACGHRQHVRHNPPIAERPWVLTVAGRTAKIGVTLDCAECTPGKSHSRE